ncbi:MAG TPA: hypothetical protein VGI10_26155 [Polyangiaceae bacterium]|jgi:hypothetical protein
MRAARAALLSLPVALAGCGGANGAALQPDSAHGYQEEQYQTLDQASAAFERFASELESGVASNSNRDESAPGDAKAPAADAPAPSAAPSTPSSVSPMKPAPEVDAESRSDRAPSQPKAKEESRKDTSCEIPCKAFASMKRAGDAICRLDTADGSHCKQAKQRIAAATDRLASCACAS